MDERLPPPAGTARPLALAAGRLTRTLADTGEMVAVMAQAARGAVSPPFEWRHEFVDECAFIVRRCLLPLFISAAALGFGAPGLQAGNFLNLIGTVDRLGAFFVLIGVREFAPFLTGMIVAGVAGTAIVADLGARKVRDEIDAMRALGMDPVRALVTPRFLALGVTTPLLLMFALVAAAFGGYAAAVFAFGETSAGFVSTFASNLTLPDLLGSLAKALIFGFVTAGICCHKGLSVSGGSSGVGRAVNESVVAAFVLIWIVNYAVTSIVLGTFPDTQAVR